MLYFNAIYSIVIYEYSLYLGNKRDISITNVYYMEVTPWHFQIFR